MSLPSSLHTLAHHAAHWVQSHPKQVTAAIGALLLGTGVTAFGVAPRLPDAALLPVQTVSEAIVLAPLGDTLNQALDSAMVLYRTDTTRGSDTPSSLLARLGVRDAVALKALSQHPQAQALFTGRAGKLVQAETRSDGRLLRLTARWLPNDERVFQRLDMQRHGDAWAIAIEQGTLQPELQLAHGTIRSSLFATTDAMNLPDSVAVQLAEMFASDIDFRRDLRQGDRFSVVYEALQADGETLRAGRVLAAEFVNNGQSHSAVWFQPNGSDQGGYYNFDGTSTRRSFLASPLEFSRVSSGYGMRFHPITGVRKAHLGVDYAAPTGTPVRTVADGVVSFAGVQRGYGNVIIVEHKDARSTLYAHLSRMHVHKGQRVNQGDFIGAVGSTGASTGPHLHFEFRVRGEHLDPLTVAQHSESIPIDGRLRASFDAHAVHMRQQLAAASLMQQASAQ